MAKSHKSVYLIWLVLFVSVASILYVISPDSESYKFKILPLDVTDGNYAIATICDVKTSVNALDSNGGIVLSGQSSAFKKHPTFELSGGQHNAVIDSFEMSHKIKCYLTDEMKNDELAINNFKEITVKSSDLTTIINGKNPQGNLIEVWNGDIRSSNSIDLTDNHEDILSTHNAKVSDIHKFLPVGDYSTELKFNTYGTINLSYDKAPLIPISTQFYNGDVMTSIVLDVSKPVAPINDDIDGDGFKNNVDACPQTPSPVNNGCPEKSGTGDNPDNPDEIIDMVEEFSLCISNFDMGCLMNQKFLPMYLGMIGFMFVIGAMTTRKTQVFDSFGNRI